MRSCIIFLIISFLPMVAEGKKVKTSFKIEKEKKEKNEKVTVLKMIGEEVPVSTSSTETDEDVIPLNISNKIRFVGYDKEINSSQESFIIVNETDYEVTGFRVSIDYMDLRDRMLHSRDIERPCEIPPGESRKIDIPSWDTQKTYYYYLGNEPKKVATPYKVLFHPQSFWVKME